MPTEIIKSIQLSPEELTLVQALEGKLRDVKLANAPKQRFYYGEQIIRDMGLTIPPRLRPFATSFGWGAAAVDTILERLEYKSLWGATPASEEIAARWGKVFKQNQMDETFRVSMRDALIYGCSYISVGAGDPNDLDEPDVLIRPESPNSVYGEWDQRSLKLKNALKVVYENRQRATGVLWLPDVTISLARENGGAWYVTDRDEHGLGFVPVFHLINNADTMYPRGKSEITKPVRGFVLAAMRTLLGAEVSREVFARPLRYMAGVELADLIADNGEQGGVADLTATNMQFLRFNEKSNVVPTMGQLPASDPGAIMNMLEPLARLAAREIGISPAEFGWDSTNPTSADAHIEANRKRDSKVRARHPQVRRVFPKLGIAADAIMGIVTDRDEALDVEVVLSRPETPTPAASADRLQKLKDMGLFDKLFPEFVYSELNLTALEVKQIKQYVLQQQTAPAVGPLAFAIQQAELAGSANVAADIAQAQAANQQLSAEAQQLLELETGTAGEGA